MTMKPSALRLKGTAQHRQQEDVSSLRLHVTRGMGEWSAVPTCVRDAISELLGDSAPPSPSISYLRPSSSTASHSASRRQQGAERTPYARHFADSTDGHHTGTNRPAAKEQRPTPRLQRTGQKMSKTPHQASSSFASGFGVLPVVPLDDDALLMSVRSFEDAEKLRQHAVRNTALFHNNVEQMSRDVRTHLRPEVRAAVQLHPTVLHELRVRSTGGDTPHVSSDAATRMQFEDALFSDVVDALQALRRASIRFTANFFDDDEKTALGIDPKVLPREAHDAATTNRSMDATPSGARRSSTTTTAADRHTLVVDDDVFRRAQPQRSAREDVRSTPPSSVNQSLDAIAFREEDEAPEDRSPRRAGRGDPIREVDEAPDDRSPRRAGRGDPIREVDEAPDDRSPRRMSRGAHVREDDEAPADRSPRRAGRELPVRILRSEEDEPESDRSPRRMRGAAGRSAHQPLAPTAQVGSYRGRGEAHREPVMPLSAEETDVFDDEPRVSPHMTYADHEPLSSDASPSRMLDMNAAEGTLPRRTVYEYAPPPPLNAMVVPSASSSAVGKPRTEPIYNGTTPVDRRACLPPTSPSPHVAALRTSPRRLVGFEPLALDLAAAAGGSVSPDSIRDEHDDGCRPRAVPPPGTPRTRNDYVIHPTPRGISVKKKTILVSRGASSDRSSAVSGVSPRSPANSMRGGSALRHRGAASDSSTVVVTTVPAHAV